ncbi:MAG: phosphoserine phosphatase SerB [Deltaproteobacteria bacterium]|nr:phosphoserine phosphatase SerB [Deltaproteobacteria bacterium]
MKPTDIILITIRGFDGPGITARLTALLASEPRVRIIDIEQTVVHRKLMLSILVQFDRGRQEKTAVLKELLFAAKEMGVSVDFEVFDHRYFEESQSGSLYAVTCLGKEIGAKPLAVVSSVLATHEVNILKIGKLTERKLACVELLIQAPQKLSAKKLLQDLLAKAHELDIDIAFQPADISRRAKRLVVMDMDSTLVTGEAIDELAAKAGVARKVKTITKQAMEGKLDFRQSLTKRVALLKGLPIANVHQVIRKIQLTKGAERLIRVLKHLGYQTAVVSGGFTFFTDYLKNRLQLDYAFANELELRDGKLTGKLVGDIIDGPGKAAILTSIAKKNGLTLDQVIAIGDGANDIPMLTTAGMGIAFHAKDVVKKAAHASIGKHSGLDSLLYLLGISDREITALT